MLTDEHLHRFQTDGYLVVENLLDPATLAAVRNEYRALLDRLYAGWFAQGLVAKAPDGLTFWDKLEQCYLAEIDWYQAMDISLPHHDIRADTPFHIGPAVFAMATHPAILDVVEQLIGPEIASNPIQHVRIKPPERAVPKSESRPHVVSTDWHQDMGVTLPEADQTQMVTVWLAITDAQIEHGCLQVVPGGRDALLPHCDRGQMTIPDAVLDKAQARPVPVKAGGAVIFDPFTPHASLANTSDVFRWSFDLRYNVTGAPSGRSQFPSFVARSRADPSSVTTHWRDWRAMWEGTRAALSTAPHIPQHRWAADGPYCA